MNPFDAFFANPNLIRPGAGNAACRLAERSCADPSGLAVLPWNSTESEARWYVLVPHESFEQVREEVLAHVGVSYTDYRGQPTFLDRNDGGDTAVSAVLDGRDCIRVDLLVAGKDFVVSEAFGRFLSIWGIRPVREFRPTRGLAEALHDYRMAVHAGQQDDAQAALKDLRRSGFDIINVRFMELELRSRFEGPTAVLAHPQINELLLIKRPALVTDFLAQAVDQVFLRPEPGLDLQSVKTRFGELSDQYRQLLTSPGQVRSESGLLVLALRYAERGDDPSSLLPQAIVGIAIGEDTLQLLDDLNAEFETPPSPDSPISDTKSQLRELLERGAYDEVLVVAEDADPVFDVVWSVLYAAFSLDSLSAARQAVDLLERASVEVRDQVSESLLLSPLLEALQDLTREAAPRPLVGDWNDYFENLVENPDWSTALEIAERGVKEWPLLPFINDAKCVDSLCSHILNDRASTVFVRTVPFLVQWLDRVSESDRSAVIAIEEALVEHLSLRDMSNSGLGLMGLLAEGLVSFGLEQDQFEKLVEHLDYRWTVSRAPETVGWATDLIETMTDYPCPYEAQVISFESTLFRSMNDFFHRLERSVKRHVISLAEELGLNELLPREQATKEAEPQDFRGVKVGLYSLTQQALRRAKKTLEDAWPGLEVVTSSDMHATRELANLARTATLMVVGTGSAQHAATDCISDNRPSGEQTRKVNGKGAMAFVRNVEAWLQEAS
jgi:hypothetical protein